MKIIISIICILIFFSPLFALEDPIYYVHDKLLNNQYKIILKEFYVYSSISGFYRISGRIINNGDDFIDDMTLYYYFYKDGSLIATDFSYLQRTTYTFVGMSPNTESFIIDITSEVDFDSIGFTLNCEWSNGFGVKLNEEALSLLDHTINLLYGTTYQISGFVKNVSLNDIIYPEIYSCVYKDSHMVAVDFSYIDADTLNPNQTSQYLDIIDLPTEYDSIKYVLGYDLYYTGDVVVPVELISFKADILENKVKLVWITASETNNYGFKIERTIVNENHWEEIGFVKGHGTTTTNNTYIYYDLSVREVCYQYRLRQIDYDGANTLSNIITINVNFEPKEFTLSQNYPNPFNSSTTINYSINDQSPVRLEIYDIQGRLVKQIFNKIQNRGNYTVNVDLKKVASGIYYYKLSSKNEVLIKKMELIK